MSSIDRVETKRLSKVLEYTVRVNTDEIMISKLLTQKYDRYELLDLIGLAKSQVMPEFFFIFRNRIAKK